MHIFSTKRSKVRNLNHSGKSAEEKKEQDELIKATALEKLTDKEVYDEIELQGSLIETVPRHKPLDYSYRTYLTYSHAT